MWRHACSLTTPRRVPGAGSIRKGSPWHSGVRGALGAHQTSATLPRSVCKLLSLLPSLLLLPNSNTHLCSTSYSSHPQQAQMRMVWAGQATLVSPRWPWETPIHRQGRYQKRGLALYSVKSQDKEMLPFARSLILLVSTRAGLPKPANKSMRHAVTVELQISNA